MYRNLTILMGVLLILFVPGESKASLLKTFLKFTEVQEPNGKAMEVAPSQSPHPSIGFDGERDGNGDQKLELIDGIVTEKRCNVSLSKWCQDSKNVIACLLNDGIGTEGSFLIVQNDEEGPVRVNLTILPSDISFREIELQDHQAKKINISASVGGSQSIVLNTGNGNCTIQMQSPTPEDKSGEKIPSGGTSISPMHGAYILASMVFIGGGAWACLQLRKRGRHLDGVAYQELEMGKPESLSAPNVETAGGWNEDWDDDDWDEEKAVKSPGGKRLRNGHANGNGIASRSSNGDGWGKDWDE